MKDTEEATKQESEVSTPMILWTHNEDRRLAQLVNCSNGY